MTSFADVAAMSLVDQYAAARSLSSEIDADRKAGRPIDAKRHKLDVIIGIIGGNKPPAETQSLLFDLLNYEKR